MHMCILTLCITLHPLESLSAVNQPVDNPWSALFFRNKFTSTVIFSSQCVIFILLKQTGCCSSVNAHFYERVASMDMHLHFISVPKMLSNVIHNCAYTTEDTIQDFSPFFFYFPKLGFFYWKIRRRFTLFKLPFANTSRTRISLINAVENN